MTTLSATCIILWLSELVSTKRVGLFALTLSISTVNTVRRSSLYALMAIHVGLASGTYVFAKAAAVGFPDAETLTLARALGAALILLLLTGWVIPKPRFDFKEWLRILLFGILLVPINQYLFLRGLRLTVPSHPALFYALTPLGVLILTSGLSRRMPLKRRRDPPREVFRQTAEAGMITAT